MHSVTDLWEWSDHALEDAGRLKHPLRYDRSTDRFVTLPCGEAFARIGDGFSPLDRTHQPEFYCSGRASQEAPFMYPMMARACVTTNFPDFSNLRQQGTSRS